MTISWKQDSNFAGRWIAATVKHQLLNVSGMCVLGQVALPLVGKWNGIFISEHGFLGLEVTYYSAEELMARQTHSVCVCTHSAGNKLSQLP